MGCDNLDGGSREMKVDLCQEARKHTCGLYFQGQTCKMCNMKIHLWLHLDIRKSADITSGKRRMGVVEVLSTK